MAKQIYKVEVKTRDGTTRHYETFSFSTINGAAEFFQTVLWRQEKRLRLDVVAAGFNPEDDIVINSNSIEDKRYVTDIYIKSKLLDNRAFELTMKTEELDSQTTIKISPEGLKRLLEEKTKQETYWPGEGGEENG